MKQRIFSAPRALLTALVFLACVFASPGCATTSQSTNSDPATTPLELTLFTRGPSGAETYYTLNKAGELGFGGGMDARLEKTSWTGPIAPEEIDHLQSLLDQHGWFTRKLHSTNQPPDCRHELWARSAHGSIRTRIKGLHPDVEPVREYLNTLALRRLNADLDRLPQPSIATQPATADSVPVPPVPE